MKKFLSLVLALVMVMSLVTVSAGAKDFTDDGDIIYDEAVDVISEIGVVDGDTNGAFRPADTLTRQAAAKIICNLILGPTTAAELHADTAPYRDVAANNQFAGYIAYCQAKGIISGYADGSFRPTGTLTGYAFMKMLLGALGYDASLENYVGANWSINVAKQALGIGLNKGLEEEFNGIKAVTRQEACLYAFNALQADLVEYGQRLTTNVNGTEVTLSSGGAQSRKWNSQQTRYDSIRDDDIVQFAEEYFHLLVKTPDTDIFERPAHTWIYDKKIQIGTWVDKDKLLETYTTEVTGRDLYDLLGSATIRDFDLEVYVDGHEAGKSSTGYGNDHYEYSVTAEPFVSGDLRRSNTDGLGITGDGVLTEVYIDKDAEYVRVVSIHTWLARATTSYNENQESATVKVYMVNATGSTKSVNVEDVPEVASTTADTFYLVTMSDKDTAKLEVVSMEEPEILEQSTITKFSNGRKDNISTNYPNTLTTDGTEYKDSDRAIYDADTLNQYDQDLLTVNTYNVYLDKYGYFIGVDLFEGTKQYVFVTGYDMKNSNLSYKTAEASGIFLDGTMENMTVNVKDTNKNIKSMVTDKGKTNGNAYYQAWETHISDGAYLLNRWYTYTKTDSGVYTLKPCVDKNGEAMMLASKTANTGSADDQTLKMNASKLRLDGVSNTEHLLQGETMEYVKTGLTSARAYGEDESVFITVDVEDVSAAFRVGNSNGKVTKAITDVNGVYTGVQDVDMITRTSDRVVGDYVVGGVLANSLDSLASGGDWIAASGSKSYVGENVYAVFDSNNFIIGAIILGEAEGNNATKAYILDPVKYERYENGTYYWQFEAVINGEIVKQEAESKFSSTIDTMRNNQFEIVELRYKDADSEIVTDVKEIERTDVNATAHLDKIYGYPFAEVKTGGHKVADNETIYDVVLTGAANGTNVATGDTVTTFSYVSRPRTNAEEHKAAYANDKTFITTQIGTLKLQGRTLYVDAAQGDYGIDFIRDAKAVVRQREGLASTGGEWKNRAYASVQEAIDSLGDANPNTQDTKEFRGIITAVLNSQGVAEWIVFYSDTLVESRADTGVGQATMTVRLKYKLTGTSDAEATEYGLVYIERDTNDGLAHVKSPDFYAGTKVIPGYKPTVDEKIILWDKNADPIKTVIFEYEPDVMAGADALNAAAAAAATVTEINNTAAGYADAAAAAAAVKDAVKKALSDKTFSKVTVAVAAVEGDDVFTPAVNGGEKGETGTDGSVKVKITLTHPDVKDPTDSSVLKPTVIDVKIVIKALSYGADKVAADEAAINAAALLLSNAAAKDVTLAAKDTPYASWTEAEDDAKAAIEAILKDFIAAGGKVDCKEAEVEKPFEKAVNAEGTTAAKDGKADVKVTLNLNGSSSTTLIRLVLAAKTEA